MSKQSHPDNVCARPSTASSLDSSATPTIPAADLPSFSSYTSMSPLAPPAPRPHNNDDDDDINNGNNNDSNSNGRLPPPSISPTSSPDHNHHDHRYQYESRSDSSSQSHSRSRSQSPPRSGSGSRSHHGIHQHDMAQSHANRYNDLRQTPSPGPGSSSRWSRSRRSPGYQAPCDHHNQHHRHHHNHNYNPNNHDQTPNLGHGCGISLQSRTVVTTEPVSPEFHYTHTLRGHRRAVAQVRISPDGRWIASASADATVKLWDASSGLLTDTFVGHMAGVNCLAWSPDNETIASGSDDKTVRLWDRITGRPKMSAKSGELVVIGGGGCGGAPPTATTKRTLGPMPPLLGHHNYVVSVAFSPRGNVLATGSFDEAVFLWDVRAGRLMRSLPAHSDPVCGLDFCLDGTMVVSCSTDGLIRIWDATTGQCLRTLVHEDNPAVTGVCFAPSGRYVMAWSLDSCIRLWDYVSGTVKKTYQGHRNSQFAMGGCFALSERGACRDNCDGETGSGGLGSISDPESEEFTSNSGGEVGGASGREDIRQSSQGQDDSENNNSNDIDNHHSHSHQAEGSASNSGTKVDGEKKAAETAAHGRAHSNHGGNPLSQFKRQQHRRHQTAEALYSLVVSPSEDGRVLLWDVTTKHLVQTLDGHAGACFWVDTNGGTLVTAGQDCTMRIYRSERLNHLTGAVATISVVGGGGSGRAVSVDLTGISVKIEDSSMTGT